MVTEEQIVEALKKVISPDLLKEVKIAGGTVNLTVDPAAPAGPIRAALSKVPGVMLVNLNIGERSGSAGPQGAPRHVVAVASGKGGVGKTTTSVNVAVALARDGARVGLLDADIYGPNVPLMMGVDQLPPLKDGKLVPAENFGVKVMSMGFLVKPGEAVIWRGPMLHGAVNKFLKEVLWGELDYLIVDLPPGTGDVQLSLAQVISLSGALIVTTPQDVALQDVERAVAMFEKVKVPVLGVVENMSGFACAHCGKVTDIFDKGGGVRAAEVFKVPFLGEVPLVPEVRAGSDSGHPLVLTHPDSPAAQAFTQIARKLAAQLSILAAGQKDNENVWSLRGTK